MVRALGRAFRGADGRLRSGWRITIVVLVWFIGLAVLAITQDLPGTRIAGLAVSNSLAVPWTIAVLAGAARWLDRRAALTDYGMVPSRAWWRELAAGLVLGLSVPALAFAATVAAGWGEVTGYLEWEGGTGPVALGLLAALVAFAGVGYFEEILFRGYLIRNAAEGFRGDRRSPRAAVLNAAVVAALVFAFFHSADISDPLTALHFVAAALYLSVPFLVTGRLGMSVGLHVAYNLGIMTVFNVEDTEVRVVSLATDGPAPMVGEGGVLETGAIVLGALLVLGWLRWRHGPLRLATELAEPPARGEGR